MRKIITLLLVAYWLPATTLAAELQPFSFTYDVNYSIAKGEMKLTLSPASNGQYSIESYTKAKGLAKLAVPNPVTEKANFDIVNGAVRGLSYQLDDGSDENKENIRIAYNWDAMLAELSSEKGPEKKTLTADSMDQLIMQAAAIADVQAGKTNFAYRQIKPGRSIQLYEYEKISEETIDTAIGAISTLKYQRSRPGSDKQTLYWFAPEYGYAPVQIERFKKGKSVFKGQLSSLN